MKCYLKLILIAISMLFSQVTFAQTISEAEAMANAQKVLSLNKLTLNSGGPRRAEANPTSQELTLAYTAKKGAETYYYVFNIGNDNGFIIAGGDAVANEILAYIPQGHFNYDSIPDNVKWWLGEYEKEISTAKKLAPKAQKQGTSAPRRVVQSNNQLDVHSFFTDIPSMISTKWGQNAPYNVAIPLPENVEGSAPTGCVATALAQIMKYWEYPLGGVGSFSYDWTYEPYHWTYENHPTFTMTYSADFGNTTYDWNNMLDDYNLGEPTQGQIDAVSTLMYHVGVATYTIYSSEASSVTSNYLHKANTEMVGLFRYFNYDLKARAVLRNDITDEDWESIIYTELKAGRPVYYSGANEMAGHAFICDGYNSSLKMFSFNWGWNGSADGYYSLCGTNMVNGFTSDQSIITHLQPAGHAEPNFAQYNDHIVVDGFHYIILNPYLKRVALTNSNLEGDAIYSGNIVVPDSIVYNGETYSVSQIDADAFQVISYPDGRDWYPQGLGCGVTSVTLPESVTRIGIDAFHLCGGLTTINLPEKLENIPNGCFRFCNSLDSIVFGNNIRRIGNYAFEECTSISKIVIPRTLKYIGAFAFQRCTNLVSVDLPSSLECIDSWAFNQTNLMQMICRSNVVPIAGSATFHGAPIQEAVLYVPGEAVNDYSDDDQWNFWKDWGEIKSIDEISPNDYLGVKISDNGFKYMLLGDSTATVIGYDNYDGEVVVPGSIYYDGHPFHVVSITSCAFRYKGITKLKILNGVKEIGEEAFQSCYSLSEIELPSSIEKLKFAAFRNNEQLKRIVIPGNVKVVGSSAFGYCSSLEEVILNEGVEQLEPHCFDFCQSLKKVILPSSIFLFGGGCFAYSDSIQEFISLSPIIYNARADYSYLVDSIGLSFSYSGSVEDSVDFSLDTIHGTLYVNESDIEFYQNNSNWKRWENIQPIVPCISISLGDQSYAISTGDTLQIYTLYEPTNTTCKQLFWTSSDPTIASVDADGVVTAHQAGTATISATSMYYPDLSDCCIVTVTPGVYQITFLNEDGTILQQDSVEYGQMPSYRGLTPEKNDVDEYNLTFSGWFPTIVAATADAEYYATYSLDNCNIIASYYSDSIQWTLCEDSVLVVYGTGILDDQCQTYLYRDKVKSAYICNGVYAFGNDAFRECTYLKNVELPSELASIGESAFQNCSYLQSIKCNASTPPVLGENAFGGVAIRIPVYVPCGSGEAYRNDPGWSYFTNIVETNNAIFASPENASHGYVSILQTPNCESDTAIIYADGQYGYVFDHWSDGNTDNPRTIVLDQDTSLTAYYTTGYTIQFYDGSYWYSFGVKAGEMPVYTGPTPTQEGGDCYYYEFTGWWPELQPVDGEAYYYAQFDTKYYKYNVVFQNFDGTILQQDSVECGNWRYYDGETPTRPSTDQYNYSFVGWSPNPNDMWVNEDKVYVAQYDSIINQYTITVSGENCTTTGDGTYDYGTEVTLTVTPDEGYRFTEWSDGVVDAIRQIIVVEDATYIAIVEDSIGTGWQKNNQSEQVQKIFDGTNYYILRGGKRYTMQGAEVK